MIRLTSDIWVSAYLTRLRLADIPAFVVQRGDATAGAVLVKLNLWMGRASFFSAHLTYKAVRAIGLS